MSFLYVDLTSVNIATEGDSNDIRECSRDDKSSTGMFEMLTWACISKLARVYYHLCMALGQ